jgi:polysaccharide pyruvyl transferase WcaK-like protein
MKVVTVLGWYGKSNCGDESYKLAFPKIFPDYEFRFVDKLTPEVIGESSAVVLGGGDILSDTFLDQLAFVKKPKHIISVSANAKVDPSKLAGFENIIVRDYKSLEILRQKGVSCKYMPDVAFALTCDKMRGRRLLRKEFDSKNREKYEKVVAIIINGFLADAEANSYDVRRFINFHKLAYDLGHIADFTPASFCFIPFGQELPWDDRVTNMWVSQKCKFWRKNTVIYSEPSVQNILDMMGAADAVISTRLHSTIFSYAVGTPFMDITHNHKNSWLLQTLEQNDYSMPYEGFNDEEAIRRLKDLLFNREFHDKQIQSTVDKQRALLEGLSDVKLV